MNDPAVLLWVRAFHIIFMVCWFAGIFYLPRLFVNHAMVDDDATKAQLALMERKLYRFITPFAWLTVLLGLWLLAAGWEIYRTAGWMHAKLALVALLAAYHALCGRMVRRFADDANTHGHVWYRWFNELPVLVLFGVILLVELKPF